jgi:hypothetical protein
MKMTDKVTLARQLRRAISLLVEAAPLSEEQTLEIADIYEAWEPGRNYGEGKIVRYGTGDDGKSRLYSVIQAHTSQDDWLPDAAPSLYRRIGFTDSGIPLWVQPLGASDAYAKGDRVSHGGGIWVSEVNANVWEPGVYGWKPDG